MNSNPSPLWFITRFDFGGASERADRSRARQEMTAMVGGRISKDRFVTFGTDRAPDWLDVN